MTITTILWTYYKSRSGKYPIKVRISEGDQPHQYHTIDGVKIAETQWDASAQKVKNHPNAPLINSKIEDLRSRLEKNYLRDGMVSAGDKEDFYWWVDERLKLTKQKDGAYNYGKLRGIFKKLRLFAPTLKVHQLTHSFLKQYEVHLIKLGNCQNTVSDNLARIRIIVNEILNDGYLEYHENPFKKIKLTTTKSKKNRPTLEEFQKLETFVIPKGHPAIQLAVDIYVASVYTGGTRWGDMCRMKWDMILEERLKYEIHKTTVDMDMKLQPKALAIFERQKSVPYIFDTKVQWANLKPGMTQQEIKAARDAEEISIDARNTFYNKKLKIACKWSGIPQFTFHTSRNFVADLAAKKKIHTSRLKEIYGHKKLSTTEIYQKDFYVDERDETMNELFA